MDDATMLSWIDRGRTLSYLLVAVGVVGEFLVDRISGPIIKRRDAAQQAEIARLNKEAGDARREAGEAMERASKNEKEAAELKKTAEDERLARVKIEVKIAPRHLTLEEQKTLAAKLRTFVGQKINVVTHGGDDEIVGIAKDIMVALGSPNGAKWNITFISGTAPTGNIGGILIEVEPNASKSANDAAIALVSALKEVPLVVSGPSVAFIHSFSGARSTGTLVVGDNSMITMTIAKKP